ncbi:MAG: cytochrome c biogenesis protein ResB [Sedimentisphaerales bacterium]|nr:cytochrome c biogenesis protein ResB [Sedimentisphaerales bacterium]
MTQETGLKNRLRRPVLWAGLLLILLLTVSSIYGAFIGAQAAQRFFNSIPLSVYWLAFAVLLVVGITIFRRLLHVRGLFLIHLGCVLVLAGGILGSQAGLTLQNAFFKTDFIHSGEMVITEGEIEKIVQTEYYGQKELPFEIKLVDFKIEYYPFGSLIIQPQDRPSIRIPAKPGSGYKLPDDLGSVEIVSRFENFKMILDGARRITFDDPNGKPNLALELQLKFPDGTEKTKYVFERFPGHESPDDKLQFFYRRTIRDFISDLEVIKDGKVVAKKSIEVNKPLHFGGYLFYQQGYDNIAGRYTILRVAGDNGLGIVYLGYILLCAGVFWHLWLRHILKDRIIED